MLRYEKKKSRTEILENETLIFQHEETSECMGIS